MRATSPAISIICIDHHMLWNFIGAYSFRIMFDNRFFFCVHSYVLLRLRIRAHELRLQASFLLHLLSSTAHNLILILNIKSYLNCI
jgi:hypothetical protein